VIITACRESYIEDVAIEAQTTYITLLRIAKSAAAAGFTPHDLHRPWGADIAERGRSRARTRFLGHSSVDGTRPGYNRHGGCASSPESGCIGTLPVR